MPVRVAFMQLSSCWGCHQSLLNAHLGLLPILPELEIDNGKTIPMQPAIERRRKDLGLPMIEPPNVDEVKKLLNKTKLNKILNK